MRIFADARVGARRARPRRVAPSAGDAEHAAAVGDDRAVRSARARMEHLDVVAGRARRGRVIASPLSYASG